MGRFIGSRISHKNFEHHSSNSIRALTVFSFLPNAPDFRLMSANGPFDQKRSIFCVMFYYQCIDPADRCLPTKLERILKTRSPGLLSHLGRFPIWVAFIAVLFTLCGSHCAGHIVLVTLCGHCVGHDLCVICVISVLWQCVKYCMAHGCATRNKGMKSRRIFG